MNKKDIMLKYIKKIKKEKLLTEFIINIFDYENFHDYNYLFRIIDEKDSIIIDIYDNVSQNRFNRYIFNFGNIIKNNKQNIVNNVYITHINVYNSINRLDNKLLKLAHLFSYNTKEEMLEYAKTFLKDKFVMILKNTIK